MADDKTSDPKPSDIVEEAKARFERAKSFYGPQRVLAEADTRFALGDSDNGWQWPDTIARERVTGQRVMLTINTTAQHCNQVINEIRRNRPSCKVSPVDGGADKKTADILGGLIRNIQASSNADDAHDVAAEHATMGGEGYWRVITEYENETSFDQAICIKAIQNPNRVYIDPDAQEMDKSDAEWGFIFEDQSKESFKREHPEIDPSSWIDDKRGWFDDKTFVKAEYFYCTYKKDKLVLQLDGSTVLKSENPKAVGKEREGKTALICSSRSSGYHSGHSGSPSGLMAGRLNNSHLSPPVFCSSSNRPDRSSSCHRVLITIMAPPGISRV